MSGFHRVLERRASSRLLVVLMLLLALVMVSVHLLDAPWSLVRLKHMTGGLTILDMQFHYTAQGAGDLLTALGPDGREFYLRRILGALDVLLPPLMATVLAVAMTVSFRGLVGQRSAWRRLQWLPLLALALDYSENVLIARLLLDFPVNHPVVATAAGWTTTAKTLAYLSSAVVCLAAVAARWRLRRVHRSRKLPSPPPPPSLETV